MEADLENEIDKMQTGILGFDSIAEGGIPLNKTSVISGSAGSSKTLFALQYIWRGLEQFGHHAVFVTFEESPADIKRNVLSFGWDLNEYEKKGELVFVDYSINSSQKVIDLKSFDFDEFNANLTNVIKQTNAQRVVIDSINALFYFSNNQGLIRQNLLSIVRSLKVNSVTSIITTEGQHELQNSIQNIGEYASDCMVILRNNIEGEKRRRTIEILKLRGAMHQKGQFPFTVSYNGLEIIPLSSMELTQHSSSIRISLGKEDIDKMCGGGVFRDSVILVSGATGTGKTLMSTTFASNGCLNGEKVMIFAYEESREQLLRNAIGWGEDFTEWECAGLLKVICAYPEVMSLEDHLLLIKQEVEAFGPTRVCIDSLSAMERSSSVKSFREFVIGLTSFLKEKQACSIVTATTSSLLGGTSVTEAHISTITDTIILLRYVEIMGRMRRGMTILKMRGSNHDKSIREYGIESDGMKMGRPFSAVGGILAGNPTQLNIEETAKMQHMFDPEENKDN